MQVVRHADVVKSAFHLLTIKELISSKKWSIQRSDTINTLFFYAALTPNEILFFNDFFMEYYNDYRNKYIVENNIDTVVFDRAYINCHPAYHPGSWHADNESGFTLLYYPVTYFDFKDEGGLEIENEYQPYVPNSLCIFDGNLKHRARMHTIVGALRFSIAFKYK